MQSGMELALEIQLTDWSTAVEQSKLVFGGSTKPSLQAQFISLFATGKNLSMVQITHQFKFFTLRFLSRQNVENKFFVTGKIFCITSIQFVTCMLRENLSNRSSGVQVLGNICTRFGRYLYSTKCSWIINIITAFLVLDKSIKVHLDSIVRFKMFCFDSDSQ